MLKAYLEPYEIELLKKAAPNFRDQRHKPTSARIGVTTGSHRWTRPPRDAARANRNAGFSI